MKIEELSLDVLKPYEKNPRKNDGAVNGVAESIKQFGFQQPIVVDKNNVIVAGHTRYKAAQKLGLKSVPCVRASELSKEQVKAYRILDNKLNELAVWDYETLAEELKSFKFDFSDFKIELPEYDLSELFEAPSSAPSPQVAGQERPAPDTNAPSTSENIGSEGVSSDFTGEIQTAQYYLFIETNTKEELDELYDQFVAEGYNVRKGGEQ